MWLLEAIGISIVIGTIGGLVWRVTEDWWERRQSRKALALELEAEITGTQTPAPMDPNAN